MTAEEARKEMIDRNLKYFIEMLINNRGVIELRSSSRLGADYNYSTFTKLNLKPKFKELGYEVEERVETVNVPEMGVFGQIKTTTKTIEIAYVTIKIPGV